MPSMKFIPSAFATADAVYSNAETTYPEQALVDAAAAADNQSPAPPTPPHMTRNPHPPQVASFAPTAPSTMSSELMDKIFARLIQLEQYHQSTLSSQHRLIARTMPSFVAMPSILGQNNSPKSHFLHSLCDQNSMNDIPADARNSTPVIPNLPLAIHDALALPTHEHTTQTTTSSPKQKPNLLENASGKFDRALEDLASQIAFLSTIEANGDDYNGNQEDLKRKRISTLIRIECKILPKLYFVAESVRQMSREQNEKTRKINGNEPSETEHGDVRGNSQHGVVCEVGEEVQNDIIVEQRTETGNKQQSYEQHVQSNKVAQQAERKRKNENLATISNYKNDKPTKILRNSRSEPGKFFDTTEGGTPSKQKQYSSKENSWDASCQSEQDATSKEGEENELPNPFQSNNFNKEPNQHGPVKLSPLPHTLYALWHEYEFGINANRAAKYIKPTELENMSENIRREFLKRSIFWNLVLVMMKEDSDQYPTAHAACDGIYERFGKETSVAVILDSLPCETMGANRNKCNRMMELFGESDEMIEDPANEYQQQQESGGDCSVHAKGKSGVPGEVGKDQIPGSDISESIPNPIGGGNRFKGNKFCSEKEKITTTESPSFRTSLEQQL